MSIEIEVLKEAAKLIEKGWTQDWFARNAQGRSVEVRSPDATCFCMAGAIRRASDGNEEVCRLARQRVLRVLQDRGLADSMPAFNDAPKRTKEEVLKVMQIAQTAEGERL